MAASIMAVAFAFSIAGMPAAAQPAPAMPQMSQLPPIAAIPRPANKDELPLYPGHMDRAKGGGEQWESYLGGPIVRNVTTPTLTPHFPAPGHANGTAIIYAPGGGFRYLGMNDAEPRLLADQGVTVFVLKYRTIPTARDSRTFLTDLFRFLGEAVALNRQPNASSAAALQATPEAVEDGLAAVRLIRSRAKEWGIDPARIGFMGSSAGGMTTLDVARTSDALARPNFAIATISPKKIGDVPSSAPPLFAAASNDDPLFPGTTENLVAAWSKAGVPVEAHFYERGGHGLPKGTSSEGWFDALLGWMKMHRWLGMTG
ncbi:MAG: alpha/beta hydrolase [Novosphingobium sp.]